jgi:sulfonate transport system ATP-binding protein
MVGAVRHRLEATDITRIFTDQAGADLLVLDKFGLTIEGNEIVGIVGPSGCGKSTFLRLVAGLDAAQGGTLLYDGKPIEGPHYDRGLVFQSAALFDWLTVYGNIAFGLKARKVFKGNEHKIDEYIKMMGLEGFEKSYPYQISGGMASRTALARTFIQNPGLVLLDEPLSALDAFTRMSIQDEVIKMHRRTGAIYLLVTHDIEEAVYLCDRVIVMSARPGRLLADIPVDLKHPRDRVSAEFVAKRREVLERLSGQLEIAEGEGAGVRPLEGAQSPSSHKGTGKKTGETDAGIQPSTHTRERS